MSENEKKVPTVVVKRLPRYYRYLGELLKQDIKRISSNALSVKMNVTASQIRQDFNYFGGFGQQGYGYNVEHLYNEIGDILGLNDGDTTVIVGAGNLGRALASHDTFEKRGFKIVGIFDVNPVLKGISIRGNEIRMMDELPEFLKEQNVDIATLTLPKNNAAETADLLVKNGIRAIWNFAHLDLDVPEDVIVENVHLSESLMRLSYNLNCYENEHPKK